MNNLKFVPRISAGFIPIALILGLTLTYPNQIRASDDVKERDIIAHVVEASPAPSPKAHPDNPGSEAKKGFGGGIKTVGRGFKNGGKATGRAFKKAGTTMGRGFKKAGLTMGSGFKTAGHAIKNFFTGGKKSHDEVEQERDLVSAETNLAEDDATLQANEDLDSVGNEDNTEDT